MATAPGLNPDEAPKALESSTLSASALGATGHWRAHLAVNQTSQAVAVQLRLAPLFLRDWPVSQRKQALADKA